MTPLSTLLVSTLVVLILSRGDARVPRMNRNGGNGKDTPEFVSLPNYPLKVFEAQGSVLTHKSGDRYLVIMGGFDNFPGVTKKVYARKIFNKQGDMIKNAKWERKKDLPIAVTHMAQAVKGDLFCGAGGYLGKHPGKSIPDAFCYHLNSDSWEKLPKLPGPRAGGGLVMNFKNGKKELIFAGGVYRKYNNLCCHTDYGDTWTLDLNNKNAGWKDVGAQMPNPRNHMGAVESCGRYFWVGGQHKEEEASGDQKTVSEYLPDQKKWKASTQLPIAIGHISASVSAYKCGILVVGGVKLGGGRLNDVLWWSPKSNKWYKIGNTPVKAATPVCGIVRTNKGDPLVCGTGGTNANRNKVYFNTLWY